MKKLILRFSVATVLVLFTGICFGQTADEIINLHIDAHGGIENWDAIQSIKITGNFTSFSEMHPIKMIKAREGKFYSEHHLGQFPVVEGCDGKTYWIDDPWFELGFPHLSNEAEAYITKLKAEFCTPFFDYKKRGFEVSYEGIEKAEGKDCYKLILTRDDGKAETWFLDTKTYLEVKSLSLWADFGQLTESEAFYDDFREVENVILPFYTERVFSIRDRILEIENVEFNVGPDPAIFKFPLSPEIQKLKFLAGNWSVIFETMGRSGKLQRADSTSSKIELVDGMNLLQEKISFINYFPINKIANWSYNSELESYVMNTFNSFYSRSEIFTGNFEADTLVFDNTQIKFNDESKEGLAKFKFFNSDENTVVMDVLQSTDEGVSWSTVQRFTYSRIME
jgi:hypothetical protein